MGSSIRAISRCHGFPKTAGKTASQLPLPAEEEHEAAAHWNWFGPWFFCGCQESVKRMSCVLSLKWTVTVHFFRENLHMQNFQANCAALRLQTPKCQQPSIWQIWQCKGRMLVAIPVSQHWNRQGHAMCGTGRQMQGSAKTPKRKAFTRLKGFSVGSQEIFGLYAWLYTKVAMYIQALCHVGKNYVPLQVGKLPSGGTSEERQTREAAWKLWRKTHRLRYQKKQKQLFCCKTNVADFKNQGNSWATSKSWWSRLGVGRCQFPYTSESTREA